MKASDKRRSPGSPIVQMVLAMVIALAVMPVSLPAQAASASQPLWLVMEKAKKHYEEGTYGSALRLFRDVLEREPNNANAHLWVGHVFYAEGEYAAAEEKYRDSLELEDTFYPFELRYEALYSLAEIARIEGKEALFRQTLERIVEEGSEEPLTDTRRRAMVRTFIRQGPDKLLELYRLQEKRVRQAYVYLGLHDFQRGEYEQALENLIISTCISLSLAIETVRKEEFDYAFIQDELPVGIEQFSTGNTRRFLLNTNQRPYLAEYFSDISFYRELFTLGAALYGAGQAQKAESLWLLTAEHREAGKWARLAREQLAGPDLQKVPSVFDG